MNKNLIAVSLLCNCVCLCIGLYFIWPRIEAHFVKHYKVVLFGDSLTFLGDWKSLLTKSSLKISGNPGFTTSHFTEILKDQVLAYNPDTCYIEGGINDIKVGIPLSRTVSNMVSLLDTLHAHKITPVVQSTLLTTHSDLNASVDSLNKIVSEICISRKVKYINLNSTMSFNDKIRPEITKDGTHLNEMGYVLWAKAIR